jgi:hypothetical protein
MPKVKVVNKKNPVIEAEEDAAPAEEQRIQVFVEAVGRIDADAISASAAALKAHRERLRGDDGQKSKKAKKAKKSKSSALDEAAVSGAVLTMAEQAVADFVIAAERALGQGQAATETIGGARDPPMFIEKYDGRWLSAGYALLCFLSALIPLAVVFNAVSVLWAWWLGGLTVYCSVLAMASTNGEVVEPRHASFLLNFLLYAVRYPVMWSYTSEGNNVALHLSLLQLALLVVNNLRNPHPIGGVFIIIVLLGFSAEILEWAGNTSKEAFGILTFTMTLVLLVFGYMLHWAPLRKIVRALHWGMSCFCRRRNGKYAAPSDEGFEQALFWLRRFLVLNLFLSYLIFAPAVAQNECASAAWTTEWLGFLALMLVVLLLSWESSPFVKLGVGVHDEGLANSMALAANCFVWCGISCSSVSAKTPLQLFMTAMVALLFFVGLQLSHYREKAVAGKLKAAMRPDVCFTISGRILLIVIVLAAFTVIAVGPVFAACSFVRGRAGCQMTVQRDVVTEPQYTPLKLGAATGLQTDPSLGRLNVRLNASLMVGLHNAYHQKSPLGSIIQSWDYSHPSLHAQLALGFRELEIDVHWKTNARDWKVFHVMLLDQRTSCSCLKDCLGQIRRWMDEPQNDGKHSPILIHIEPRGYKYNDLFCKRLDGAARLAHLQQMLFDIFSDKLYFPDELTAGFPSIYAALQGRGWPYVEDMRGKIVLNMNLFGSNNECRQLYWDSAGASFAGRLGSSDTTAAEIGAKMPTAASIAAAGMDLTRKRRIFFIRGPISEAKATNYTASMEVTTSDYANSPEIFSTGFITRFRVGKKPEASNTILAVHSIQPATLISYDGVWPG